MLTISVITPTLNRAHMLSDALASVAGQTLTPLEYIVMDGGSTDGTAELLASWQARGMPLDVLSEPDGGLYDAINKGIRRSRGDVICLLNSDDRLPPMALAEVAAAFAAHPEADCVCGRVLVEPDASAGRAVVLGTPAMQRLRAEDVISGIVLTNGRFFRRHVFEHAAGYFDPAYPVLADRAFMARVWLAGVRTVPIEGVVYHYRAHAGSLTFSGRASAGRLQDAIALAARELQAARTPREAWLYHRWLGWATGYAIVRGALRGQLRVVASALARGTWQLPTWPWHFLRQLAWHLATRAERRGCLAPVSASNAGGKPIAARP
ncbi:MAG TPA: glycosyltransferase family 2 protein [bacterium]|nr:glycosyltransferase family 2 protein [bacterium]